jgi:protein-disulfide isomerase
MESDIEAMSKKERRELKRQMREQKSATQSTGMVRSFMIWGGVIFALVLGLWWLSSGTGESKEVAKDEAVDMQVSDKDWVKGNKDGKIVLVEYSDFQCPACRAFYPIVEEVIKANADVKLVYRNFPLRSIHKNAQIAAQAAEAAGMQGKFFEMHDKLFSNQEEWALMKDPNEKFVTYAKEIGLDTTKFGVDMKSNEAKSAVEEDYSSAMRLRVNATPTFFVNGKKIANPKSKEEFLEILQSEAK